MDVADTYKKHVRDLLIEGRKIEAIKYLKTNFSLTLYESKQLVEILDKEIDDDLLTPHQRHRRSKSKHNKVGHLLGIIFGLVGAIMITIVVYLFVNNQNFIEKAILTTAVVVSSPHQPVFEYEVNEEIFTYYSNVSSDPPSYYIGEEVAIYINQNDPYDVLIDTFMDRWFAITLLGGLGVVFFGIGLGTFLAFKVG